MRKFTVVVATLLAAGACATGGETKTWSCSEREQFEKGTLRNLSLRSDGHLTLAPVVKELYDSSAAYLWALVSDSRGNLYTGGGGTGGSRTKLYMLPAGGSGKVLAEVDGMEIHALAVDGTDRVYAATSPDGKVYRVGADGKAEVFYNPGAKYIWTMAFSGRGDLYIATGDRGEIHKVSPQGKGSVFFKTDETHVRSLAIDASDNLIVGTEPGGLVLRISPAGEGFVVYQAGRREVTAVAVAASGAVYAAAVGTRQAPTAPGMPAMPAPMGAPPPGAPGQPVAPRSAPVPPPTFMVGGPAAAGGSEVYRIEADGSPRKVWSHAQEIVYAIGFDKAGRALIGSGNKGNIYRLNSDTLYTLLLTTSPTQITALTPGREGETYAASANVGKVYRIGPELEREGSLESEAFDARMFSYWGRIEFRGDSSGGAIAVSTRSGNLDRPQKNWSAWSAASTEPDGGRAASPAARFVQWKASLTASGDGRSPELESVSLAYLPKNAAPVIDEIEITPANYKFPPQSLTLTPSQNITLPPLPRRARRETPQLSLDTGSQSVSMQYAKGHIGARWAAGDPNGDELIYKAEIRGVAESEWKLLKERVKEKHLSWDSTAFPDGDYRVRITASDAPDNPPDKALRAQSESPKFTIDNTPPEIGTLAATLAGGKLAVRWKARDARSVIQSAEYSLDGGVWTTVEPTTKLSDSREHDYVLTIDGVISGEHTIAVRVSDECDNQAVAKVVVKP